MADTDNYPKRYPTSQKGEKIDHGTDVLAETNPNRHIRDDVPVHINPEDSGRYERPDNRTPEERKRKPAVL